MPIPDPTTPEPARPTPDMAWQLGRATYLLRQLVDESTHPVLRGIAMDMAREFLAELDER